MSALDDAQRERLRESGLNIGDVVTGRWLGGRVATISRFRPCGDRFVDAVLERDGVQIGWCGIEGLTKAAQGLREGREGLSAAKIPDVDEKALYGPEIGSGGNVVYPHRWKQAGDTPIGGNEEERRRLFAGARIRITQGGYDRAEATTRPAREIESGAAGGFIAVTDNQPPRYLRLGSEGENWEWLDGHGSEVAR